MLKFSIRIVLLSATLTGINADTQCKETYYQRSSYGPSLPLNNVISTHNVINEALCYMFCMQEKTCVGFNYRAEHKENEDNCQLSDTSINVTHIGGEWTFYQDPQIIVTIEAFCGDPGTPSRGYTEGSSFTYASNVTFHCNESTDTLEGASFAICLSNSSWSNLPPKCIPQHLSLRLQGSGRPHRGRLEIYRLGYGWYTICNHRWDVYDATVACRQLGFRRLNAVYFHPHYGRGTGEILDFHPLCNGTESSLKDCRSEYGIFWRIREFCSHNEDISIDCLI